MDRPDPQEKFVGIQVSPISFVTRGWTPCSTPCATASASTS